MQIRGSRRDQTGAITAEYVALLIVVASVVAAIVALGLPGTVSDLASSATCRLFGGDCGTAQGPTGTGQTPGAGIPPVAVDPLADPLADPRATLEALAARTAGPGDVLVRFDDRTRRQLLDQARQFADDPTRLQARYGANRLLIQDQADRLTEVADRDGADLATWREFIQVRPMVPGSTVRDPDQLARYQQLLQQVRRAPPGSLLAEMAEVDAVTRGRPRRFPDDVIDRNDVIERMAGRAGERAAKFTRWAESGRQFLRFDPSGDGRVAEVLGDLKQATNVAVVVPGTGNDISNFDDQTASNGKALRRVLDQQVDHNYPGASTAVISCLCYDAPDDRLAAAQTSYATEAADELAGVVDQIEGYTEDATMTVIGHSFGSTAVGHAITEGGLTADEVIGLASPGLGVSNVEELGDGVGRVWGIRHPKDPIDLVGILGRNPDRSSFGAASFDVGDGDFETEWWKRYEGEFHSVYYQDRLTLRNMARVVLGDGESTQGYQEER